MGVDGVQADLVLFGLGGVPRFLRESRTTADVAGASIVVQELSRRAAARAGGRLAGLPRPYGLIVPAPAPVWLQCHTVEPTVVVDRRREPLRRASPVWLRPIQLGEDNWRVFTHAFLARLLPTNAELHIVRNRVYGKRLDVPPPELVKDTWDRWLEQDYRLPDGFYGTD
jgi:hypothetical protein